MTPTPRDRLNLLLAAGEGFSPETIAAIMGIDAADVISAMEDPNYVLADSVAGRLVSHSFAHDTPGLADGIVVYTPQAGDVLVNAWFSVSEAWNGTTPFGDLGPFQVADGGAGAFGNFFNSLDMTQADPAALEAYPIGRYGSLLSLADAQSAYTAAALDQVPAIGSVPSTQQGLVTNYTMTGVRVVPAPMASAPYKVVVSQTGKIGDPAPGSTQGHATVYLQIAHATPSPG